MKNKKIKVAVLFGGKSAEHEVSIQSAKNVYLSLDKEKYDVVLVGIDRKGRWYLPSVKYLLESNINSLKLLNKKDEVSVIAGGEHTSLAAVDQERIDNIDVVFPVMHGPFGEDGSMQGFLKLANIPFVGSGVLGSAIGMDKDVAKRLLRDAGLPVGKFLVFNNMDKINFHYVERELGLPVFVKPANLGSSIGVSKVKNEGEFDKAIAEAFAYDSKIIIEEFTKGREIECSVLGNEDPVASIPGEIIPVHEFYDYSAKYIDADGARLKIPAGLPKEKIKEIQELAIKTFKVLCLEGMARIDFFLTDTGKLFISEPNTIPGFTNISMYPKLWEESGIEYSQLIDKLIELAIEKYDTQKKLKTSL